MPRYIDAEKIRPYKGFFEKVDNVPKFYDWVESLPTADVVEVKHGKWIWQGSISEGCWTCSECEYKFYQGYGNENFCPNCGAKMSNDSNTPNTLDALKKRDNNDG